jgi:hypothetical protein
MVMEDYQKSALAINAGSECHFHLEILVFYTSKIVISTEGDAWKALKGLKNEDCSKLNEIFQGDIGEYCV